MIIACFGYVFVMALIEHPWGVTFDTEFRASSCFLAGEDYNIKKYCNDVALSQCRDSNLSLCLDQSLALFGYVGVLHVFICARECVSECCVCVCLSFSVCLSVCLRVAACLSPVCTSLGGNKNTAFFE